MIVVDSSIWVDFLRDRDERLALLIAQDKLLQHPFVTGEVGMGSFASVAMRAEAIATLFDLAPLAVVPEPDFHDFVATNRLYGTGAGFVDCHLLASMKTVPEARLWTRDRRLKEQAVRLELQVFT